MIGMHHDKAEGARQTMLHRAEEIARERTEFTLPHGPEDLPALQHASNGLSVLNDLVQDVCEDLHFLSQAPEPTPALDAAVEANARAAGHLSQAVGHYGAALRQLGFLRRHSQSCEHPQLDEARSAAFTTAQQHIAETRDSLASAHATLLGGAEDLEDTPSLSQTARARSTQPEHARSQSTAEAEPAAAPIPTPPAAPAPRRR